MPRVQKQVLGVMIAGALLVSFWALGRRVTVERDNRTVAVAVDYDQILTLSGLSGRPPDQILRALKGSGATHVAIREETLGELILGGRVAVVPGPSGLRLVPAPEITERLNEQLRRRTPGIRTGSDGALAIERASILDQLRPVGVGYSEAALANARASGLAVVARPVGEMTVTPQSVEASLDAVVSAKADTVVFSGLQVAGYRELIDEAAEQMKLRGIRFGFIEMAKQVGETELAAAMDSRIVRCHAVAAAEMVKLYEDRAVERFALAVRERNVRLCYVRPYLLACDDPVADAQSYVARIAAALVQDGFRTGNPVVYSGPQATRGTIAAVLIGTGAASIWLVQLIFALPRRMFWWLIVADVILASGAAFAAQGLSQSVGALGAAIVFPTLALVAIQLPDPGGKPSIWRAIGMFLFISMLSLCGGLLAAASLSDLSHMMQLATFRGVKLAQMLPLLAVLAVFIPRCTRSYLEVRTELGPDLPEWPALRAGIIEAADAAVRYWHVALILCGMVMAAVLLMRSGNVSPMPPSDLELSVRSLLQDLLVVRPRTKEIFFGHPALILSLAFLLAGWRRGAWIGLLMGAIGQISLVNTFGHIHTPLMISLVRAFNGVWIGCVVALLMWYVGFVGIGGIVRRWIVRPRED